MSKKSKIYQLKVADPLKIKITSCINCFNLQVSKSLYLRTLFIKLQLKKLILIGFERLFVYS